MGVYLIKEFGKGIDSIVGIGGVRDIDWMVGDNMKILSFFVVVNIIMNLKFCGLMYLLCVMVIFINMVYEYCFVLLGWLGKFV